MAADNWLPRRYRLLSSRLVNSQGIIFFGICALLILLFSDGRVSWLVVLYSINVFVTFSLTTLGMMTYWLSNRTNTLRWWNKFAMALLGFILTSFVLCVVLISKFFEGGYVTLIVTCVVIFFCYLVRRHYRWVGRLLRERDREIVTALEPVFTQIHPVDPSEKTAIIFVTEKVLAMHSLLWVLKHFPGYFKNFVFIGAGQVDIKSFSGKRALKRMTKEVDEVLNYFVTYCQQKDLSAASYSKFESDYVECLFELSQAAREKYPDHMFFATQISFQKDTWFNRFLHNGINYVLQRKLHGLGDEILLLPMSF
jgi:K+ transporter